jgi:flagellar hook-associated protein 2
VGSPITFSGFNDIDFNVVLNAIMQQASQPLTALQTRQTQLKSQTTSFDDLASRVATLSAAVADLATPAGVTTLSGRSSDDTAVAVTTSQSAVAAHFDVVVTELARAQVTASTSTTPDSSTTVVADGGSIVIGGVDVAISGPVTLDQLAQAINGTAGIGVSAMVVRTGASAYRLALTGAATGAAHAFTITNGLTGGTGVTFADTDGNGVSGDSAADNAVSASDAAMLVNNIPVTGDSNTFADIVPGVTLTLLKKDPAVTIGIDVASDGAALREKVSSVVNAYNDLVTFANEQRALSAEGDAAGIGRDPVLRQLQATLRTTLLGAHGTLALTRLSEVGIEFTRTGTLEINDTLFDEAIATNGAAVVDLFAGSSGAFVAVESLLDTFTAANGSIPSSRAQLERQIDALDTQIATMQERLALQRASLQQEFIAADLAMSRLRNQASSLANLGGGFGSF